MNQQVIVILEIRSHFANFSLEQACLRNLEDDNLCLQCNNGICYRDGARVETSEGDQEQFLEEHHM